MDLGLRARQTTWGEQRGGNTGAEVQNVCTQWICTHSYTHTNTHMVWLDICTIQRTGGLLGWEVRIPPQDSSNLQSPSAVGSNGFHPVLPDWVRPVITAVVAAIHLLSFVLAALSIASVVF